MHGGESAMDGRGGHLMVMVVVVVVVKCFFTSSKVPEEETTQAPANVKQENVKNRFK